MLSLKIVCTPPVHYVYIISWLYTQIRLLHSYIHVLNIITVCNCMHATIINTCTCTLSMCMLHCIAVPLQYKLPNHFNHMCLLMVMLFPLLPLPNRPALPPCTMAGVIIVWPPSPILSPRFPCLSLSLSTFSCQTMSRLSLPTVFTCG